jgi:hypothetical protein
MKATLQVELQPFQTPNYVLTKAKPLDRQEGMQEAPKYHLSEFDSATLDKLCREFRREVFGKAGKAMPPEQG